MKIISKQKDYYDYISHEFGVDPLIVFKRKTEITGEVEFKNIQGNCPIVKFDYEFEHKEYGIPEDILLKILVVCGTSYPLFIYENKPPEVVSLSALINLKHPAGYYRFHGRIEKTILSLGKFNSFWIDWHKKLDTPIFICNYVYDRESVKIKIMFQLVPICNFGKLLLT